MVRQERQISIGDLRMTECRLPFANIQPHKVTVQISVRDFQGFRTAMFGKTRLGKSNVVKLLAEAVINATAEQRNVGQLIFDINGEYANDNPQDGNISIRSKYEDRCQVYALNQREGTTYAKQLKLNFYEQPDSGISILKSFLAQANKTSDYIKSFMSVELPDVEDIPHMEQSPKIRSIRKIQFYWAILYSAGYTPDEERIKQLGKKSGQSSFGLDPKFKKSLRNKAYNLDGKETPDSPKNLAELVNELRVIDQFRKAHPGDDELKSSEKEYFDPDDKALLDFLFPKIGRSGPTILRPYKIYHSSSAGDFQKEILDLIIKDRLSFWISGMQPMRFEGISRTCYPGQSFNTKRTSLFPINSRIILLNCTLKRLITCSHGIIKNFPMFTPVSQKKAQNSILEWCIQPNLLQPYRKNCLRRRRTSLSDIFRHRMK